MKLYLLLSIIIASVSGLFSVTRQFQMFQQNSYFLSRYYSWLKGELPLLSVAIYVIVSLLFGNKLYFCLFVLCVICLVANIILAIKHQKKSIKKLVFTSRIKRLYFTSAIILFVLILLYVIFPKVIVGGLAVVLLLLLSLVSPILCFLAAVINAPVEKSFAKGFIKDAKKKLGEHKNLKVIGITGSYGKTSVKFILTRILSERFNTLCTPQSFNTPMGVVRTVREHLKPQTEIFVCEMGAKNIGDIKEICDIVSPDYGIITSVGPQHLDTFKSVDNVFKAKFELYDAVKQKGSTVFVNGDSKELISRINQAEYTVYGTNPEFDYSAKNISYKKDGSQFDIKLGDETVTLKSKLLGMHNIINITGAAALAYSLGVSAKEIKYAVASLKPTEHRLEMKPCINGSVMIDNAYNSNPEGSIGAVNVLGSFDEMKKVIITPGLVELGDKEYDYNYALGLEAAKICDIIILVGKNRSKPMQDAVNSTSFNKENLFVASSFFEAMDIYNQFANNNTVVLVENDLPDNYLN